MSCGAAWVFTRTGGVWSQEGSKLVGAGAVGNAQQGRSVSISSDGNTAIVGGFFDNGGTGAAWVFTRIAGVWTPQGSKLVGTGAIGDALQGSSVSISSDGNTAIVGGYGDNGLQGAAWLYTRTTGVWTQQGSKLVGTGVVGNALQGISVFLSSDGNSAILGGYNDNNAAGAAWVFTRGPSNVRELCGEVPQQCSLTQNYPNPFNPSTTIRYALPHRSFVTLTVYNTIGQQVAQLVNEQQQAGYHDVVLRADQLASGVYFYRLDAGQFTSVKKLLMLK